MIDLKQPLATCARGFQSASTPENPDSPRSLSGGAAGSRGPALVPRNRAVPAPLGGGGPSILRKDPWTRSADRAW
jgi:hypothetical protein